MWNSYISNLAEVAKTAVVNVENQLNSSVGVEQQQASLASSSSHGHTDDFNVNFDDEFAVTAQKEAENKDNDDMFAERIGASMDRGGDGEEAVNFFDNPQQENDSHYSSVLTSPSTTTACNISTKHPVDEVQLSQMIEMGFDKDLCIKALKQTENCMDDAMILLLENPLHQIAEEEKESLILDDQGSILRQAVTPISVPVIAKDGDKNGDSAEETSSTNNDKTIYNTEEKHLSMYTNENIVKNEQLDVMEKGQKDEISLQPELNEITTEQLSENDSSDDDGNKHDSISQVETLEDKALLLTEDGWAHEDEDDLVLDDDEVEQTTKEYPLTLDNSRSIDEQHKSKISGSEESCPLRCNKGRRNEEVSADALVSKADLLVDEFDETKNQHQQTMMVSNEALGEIEQPIQIGYVADQIDEVAAQLLQHDPESKDEKVAELQAAVESKEEEIEKLKHALQVREKQLEEKGLEIVFNKEQHDREIELWKEKVNDTKDEAKKRISRAKERVEELQARLASATSNNNDDEEKDEIIAALRSEGEALAKSQSQVEQALRSAKGEVKQLKSALDDTEAKRDVLESKIQSMKLELKETKKQLDSSKAAEKKLNEVESNLAKKTAEIGKNALTQKTLKEKIEQMQKEIAQARAEAESSKQGLMDEGERTAERLKVERDQMLTELEAKILLNEKEAAIREDALRHEVEEIRKRWQDAVRRADTLSIDLQESTAPLMRQIEATEKQNRSRASAWTQLETKLRTELEENIVSAEALQKEVMELRASEKRNERRIIELESSNNNSLKKVDVIGLELTRVKTELARKVEDYKQLDIEHIDLERRVSDIVNKVKADMMKKIVDSEETHRQQLDIAEDALQEEKVKRKEAEMKLSDMSKSISNPSSLAYYHKNNLSAVVPASKNNLESTLDQEKILRDTLSDELNENKNSFDNNINTGSNVSTQPKFSNGGGSFAAMEQLTQNLKRYEIDIASLRKQLTLSEETRRSLTIELNKLRELSELVPELEQKVDYLAHQLKEKELEIMGLKEDMLETKEMYRVQLDVLVEEQAAKTPIKERPKVLVDEEQQNGLLSQKQQSDDEGQTIEFLSPSDVIVIT